MNDAIESIMSFINENTTILICICLFLIVVLVIYLIETSIKSKKIDKKIEEESQKTKDLVEQHNLELQKEKEMKETNKKFEDAIINEEVKEINLVAEDLEKKEDSNIFPSEPEVISPLNVSSEPEIAEINKEESNKEVDVLYKDDKKLSEILFGEIEKQPEGKLDSSIVSNEEEIEQLSSVDELEEIMKKLNSYENK